MRFPIPVCVYQITRTCYTFCESSIPKVFQSVCFLFLNSTTLRSCVKIYDAVWSGQVGPFATGQVGPLEKTAIC